MLLAAALWGSISPGPLPARAAEAMTPATDMPPEAAAARPERPEEMVRALYRALDGRDESFSPADWTDEATARRLFVPGLVALAVKEGQRAVPDRRLPFDPFTGALQIRPERVAVRAVSASAQAAEVMARFTVSHTTYTVNYRLSLGADGWRIADIWWGTDKRRTFRRLLR